jgi:transposase InsO family protein
MNYRSRRDLQHALRVRLREVAASRVRFGYRRLTVMLRRDGWPVNAKRIYRLYTEDGLAVRTKVRKKVARRSRVPLNAHCCSIFDGLGPVIQINAGINFRNSSMSASTIPRELSFS